MTTMMTHPNVAASLYPKPRPDWNWNGHRNTAAGTGVDEVRSRPGRRLRVLIVDDDRDFADSSSLLVGLWGYNVRVAYGGDEALDCVAAFPPDVCLLDIRMPGVAGFELAARLRVLFREALLVAVTGLTDETSRERGVAAGFDEHLLKPADPLVLESLLLVESCRLARGCRSRHPAEVGHGAQ
jgi:CheY-like chemotaxis protein